MNNYIDPEILKLVKTSDLIAFDKNQKGPSPSDFGNHLEIPEDSIREVPGQALDEESRVILEQLPMPQGLPL